MPFSEREERVLQNSIAHQAYRKAEEENVRVSKEESAKLAENEWNEAVAMILNSTELKQVLTEYNDPELAQGLERCSQVLLSDYFRAKCKFVCEKPKIYMTSPRGGWINSRELPNGDKYLMAILQLSYGIFSVKTTLFYKNFEVVSTTREFTGYPNHYSASSAADNDNGQRTDSEETSIGRREFTTLDELLDFIAQVIVEDGVWSSNERKTYGFKQVTVEGMSVYKKSR